MARRSGLLFAAALLAACHTPPPRPWLRFEQAGTTQWGTNAEGLHSGRLHGVDVAVDLGRKQTSVLVTVDNRTAQAVEFRVGPEGGSPRVAIGEVLLRPLDGGGQPGGPATQPYNALQPVAVEPGWRASFFLDKPLGRDVVLGQYFVLAVEARRPDGTTERRTLPLRAEHAGSMPADGT